MRVRRSRAVRQWSRCSASPSRRPTTQVPHTPCSQDTGTSMPSSCSACTAVCAAPTGTVSPRCARRSTKGSSAASSNPASGAAKCSWCTASSGQAEAARRACCMKPAGPHRYRCSPGRRAASSAARLSFSGACGSSRCSRTAGCGSAASSCAKARCARLRANTARLQDAPVRARCCAMASSGVRPMPPATSRWCAASGRSAKPLRGVPTASRSPSRTRSCRLAEPPRLCGSRLTPIT